MRAVGGRLLRLGLAGLLGLLLLEGAIRLRQVLKYGTAEPTVFRLVQHAPTGLMIPEPSSVVGEIAINSAGFRGPEIRSERPPGTLRLAFVGASTTFCAEVSNPEATWPAVLVARLRASHPSTAFDYLNAGVPGYTSVESLKNLQGRVLAFAPDVVILYEGTNDLVHLSRAIAIERGLIEPDDGQPGWLARHWLTLNLFVKNLRYRRLQDQLASGAAGMQLEPGEIGRPFGERLEALLDASRSAARLTVVCTFATRLRAEQKGPELAAAAASAKYYMPYFDPKGLVAGYAEINAAIRSTAGARPDVLLVEGENEIPGDGAHFVDTVHFRDAGALLQAERVERALAASPAFHALVEERAREKELAELDALGER